LTNPEINHKCSDISNGSENEGEIKEVTRHGDLNCPTYQLLMVPVN